MIPVLGWARLATAGAARVLLLSWVCLALWAAAPIALGWQPTTVASGSMEPRIHVGDVVVAKPATAAQASAVPGRVVLADDPDHPGRLRLHRFARLTADGELVLKGDANPQEDSTPVAPRAVHGVGVMRIPDVGLPVVWLKEGRWTHLAALAAAVGLLVGATRLDRELLGASEEEEPSAPVARTRSIGPARLATPAVVLAAVVLVSLPDPAHAQFSAVASTPTNTLAAATYFTCGNAVMANQPSLYYRFDATSGSVVADDSGQGNSGATSGGVTLQQSPAPCSAGGTAVRLDGTSGYVHSTKAVSYPDTFTIELWFRTTTTRGGRLIGFGSSATGVSTHRDRHLYLTNGGAVVFGVSPGSTVQTISSGPGYADGTWHLATATLAPTGASKGMRLYLDGRLVASNSQVTTAERVTPTSSKGYWRIGYDSLSGWPNRPTSDWFAGTVDDAAVYPSALGADVIAAHQLAAR